MPNETRQQAEFVTMLEQCKGTLTKVCLYYCDRNSETFKDLYQDIVCQLWESWPSFRKKSAVNTWVTRIALNTASLQYRNHKRMPTFVTLNENLCDTIACETADMCYQRLYDLIDLLEPDERKLLYLYLDKKRLRDIALTTGISENAVKQRIHRIKQKLIQLNEKKNEQD